MEELFDSLKIRESLIKALEKENITIPTQIQQKVIPEALTNKDLIAEAETGSGKTLAYLLPLFEKVKPELREMQAIVLVPTHELAIQVLRQIERLALNSEIKVTSTPVIGDVNIVRQIDKLKERPHIIVGSPGRILELIKKKKITAHTIKTIVLDEADRLVDEHNIISVLAIIKSTQRERQLMMFSATMPQKTIEQAKKIMKEPEIIKSEATATVPSTIEHIYFVVEPRDKLETLKKLIKIINPAKALAFLNKSEEVEIAISKMQYHNFKAAAIHGTHFKVDRKRTLEEFRSGKIQLLLASDVVARGLDIDDITHIFNIDMPEDPKNYLHRVGRTARCGKAGVAISIITTREIILIEQCAKKLKIKITEKELSMGKIIDVKKKSEFVPKKKLENVVPKKTFRRLDS